MENIILNKISIKEILYKFYSLEVDIDSRLNQKNLTAAEREFLALIKENASLMANRLYFFMTEFEEHTNNQKQLEDFLKREEN